MTTIRPMRRDDVPAAAALFERRSRSGTTEAPAALVSFLERQSFDAPWRDDDLPSLVAEDRDGRLIGFQAVNPRRLRVDSRPVRLACGGPMVIDPDHPGTGILLTRAFLAGPQEVTLTDGASDSMHHLWTTLRGRVRVAASFQWQRILRPGGAVAALLRERGRALPRPAGRAVAAGDGPLRRLPRVGGRLRATPPEDLTAEPLTVEALLEQMSTAPRRWRLFPDYDERYLRWLFDELEAVTPVRGRLVAHLVRTGAGRVAGWYVYFLPVGGTAQVQQIASTGPDPGPVLDHLLAHADAHGAAAVAGRVEPSLVAAVRRRRCLIRPATWSLVNADDDGLLGLLESSDALLTRLDGEWWMAPHLLWRGGNPA
ncbi:GNAT family N-acetyltransferase [Actinomycetospora straminea]|uniref:GNAT family N-acetyltransferase n=1 Tax=Actinomycetospora straminea TaxID=663607 RepID=A0ABP9F103_9PSEU|nr:hypothetical protein [Actinomycetospora straminea]MDD7934709.1 hypothetical protein [Actinomycetospora straminea]